MSNRPFVREEEGGPKAICACGRSANRPYCDGAHARENTGKRPVVVDVKEGVVAWCGCTQSANFPYCDGTHASL